MNLTRIVALFGAATLLVAACGDDDTVGSESTTTVPGDGSTTTIMEPDQAAVWPAAGVVFDTPEEAAEDFVANALGVVPVLGQFQQSDSRSGEIEVLSPGEGEAATPVVRGLLLLRQLGSEDGWFVIGAVNENASITVPAAAAEVTATTVTVEGEARGFEAAVVVSAFRAGDRANRFDEVVTQGGALEEPLPYSVELDLSGAAPGDVVVLLVRGGTGLETDPGDFSAIPVVVTG